MKKYCVLLDPDQVERLRQQARQNAAELKEDVSWVALLREAADYLLAGGFVTKRASTRTPVKEQR